ncbi:hypothetical protein TWF106_005264 [Orbilia oligospora]|uniref:Uncharacterized protein n=1 Tax=Orbilia oligospora TaxID=2813651 RepID=A0A7C8QST0_ORBOL|nr:hypothetical protein TWF106_005264 [Orbilia oligospora]
MHDTKGFLGKVSARAKWPEFRAPVWFWTSGSKTGYNDALPAPSGNRNANLSV